MDLTQDEKEVVAEIMVSEQWKVVIKLCGILANRQGEALLSSPATPDALMAAKHQYDGAMKLIKALDAAKRQLTKGK